MPRSALSFAFFASSQAKYFTAISVAQRVLDRHTLASSHWSVPVSAPKRGPRAVIREPTAANVPIKTRPEIIAFRPVLRFLAALANRLAQLSGSLRSDASPRGPSLRRIRRYYRTDPTRFS